MAPASRALIPIGVNGNLCTSLEAHFESDCWQRQCQQLCELNVYLSLLLLADQRTANQAVLRRPLGESQPPSDSYRRLLRSQTHNSRGSRDLQQQQQQQQ